MPYSGFCVGGVDWPRPELRPSMDEVERNAALRALATREARMVHELGGNMLRAFYSVQTLVRGPLDELELAIGRAGPGSGLALYRRPLEERVANVDRCATILDRLLVAVEGGDLPGFQLSTAILDAYIEGVERFNAELGGSHAGVRVLLTLVAPTPRWIIEAPSAATLQALGRVESFHSLWERYLRLHASLHRLLVRRYVTGRDAPALAAIEVGNEPDYLWTPEEMKIETSSDPLVSPLSKYVTELHLPQVPERDVGTPAFDAKPWGFGDQDAAWPARGPDQATPVLDFDWGVKLDWYVRCFADLQCALADAIGDEAAQHGVSVDVVSASVTHNNIDYLVRMQRANPRAFASTSKIGIHPYHWPRNDVWDDHFRGASPMEGWISASPRAYASDYFKRFDFLEQLALLTAERRPFGRRARALPVQLRAFADAVAGKQLWITEFGFGTKVLGAHNSPVAEFTRFIRPRGEVGVAAGYPAAIWEDLWESFLDQVDAPYLTENRVESLLLYSLRELGTAGLDMDDEDRSNLALLRADESARLEPRTLGRVSGLLGSLSGKPSRPTSPPRPGLHLHAQPWRQATLPESAANVMTMLSEQERQLLYWLGSAYFTGAGAIVDGGCFVGGSTLSLAEGLRANAGRPAGAKVHVFDLFQVEPYMADLYFAERGLEPGDSFRHLFDENTEAVNDLLLVTEGDLAKAAWEGPIEILFVDIAKSWGLNEVVIQHFFRELIPDRSVVVQQDFVFGLCPWVPITMEYFADCFEPVAFVDHNSVVYICRATPATASSERPLHELPLDDKLRLVDSAVRRFRGYPRGILECAAATILAEAGDHGAARDHMDRIRRTYSDDERVMQALALQERLVRTTP